MDELGSTMFSARLPAATGFAVFETLHVSGILSSAREAEMRGTTD